ncbi:translational GTPase TypA [Candidatus Peregrinibacteria bacterium]|nr:translational GTPase TypA [Candidatus Peregrinibacteria bacterium]
MKVLNIAIIAHVDHGKTTLTDALLRQGGAFRDNEEVQECVMDSNPLERERGITIFSKNCSIRYKDIKINIVDTPGHADFSSEVERILRMVDCVLLLVDAQEGPMPQTKFVLQKSLTLGIRPIVLINKIDKKGARPNDVLNQVFDLFVDLNANDLQLDFPVLYTIGKQGIAKNSPEEDSKDLTPLFEMILKHVPLYPDKNAEPLQMQIASLAYDNYIGRVGIGRVFRGKLQTGQQIALCRRDGTVKNFRITKLFSFEGLKQEEVEMVECGDLAAVAGIEDITIGETITDPEHPDALPVPQIDEPTLKMNFLVNNSPFAGQEGSLVTTRNIKERLERELQTNVGLKVEDIPNSDGYTVSGRGELHLSILLENMRREGYEIQVSRPEVIYKKVNGKLQEPIELLVATVPEKYSGIVIEKLGKRKGLMQNMVKIEKNTRLEYYIPTRGLIGFRSEFIMETHGEGILDHSFSHYEDFRGEIERRKNGALISQEEGETMAYALWKIQERGILFCNPVTHVYEGMIIGENAKEGDIIVNACKGKKLTNMRASGSDDAIMLVPPKIMTLEQALEFIEDDELVEITPKSIRLRKKILKDVDRKRAKRV